jgi:O-methyltransferase domain/Dimerisation domain
MNMNPQQQIGRMLTGYWVSQALYVAAKLKLADQVKDGPRTAEDLAAATGVHAPSLFRLLRALASVGVFAEDSGHRFGLTPLADCLRSDVTGSQWALAIMNGEEHYRAWGDVLYSIQTGQPAFDRLFGAPVFDHLSHHPQQARIFDAAMVGVHGRETAAMLDAYDFSGVRVLADVGGGNGSLLTAVLKRYTPLQGILFDLPGVAERARANIEAAGLADRCRVVGGSFFETVERGADACLMRHIIHDWDDEKSLRILRNVHAALPDEGKLLLVESVIPPGNGPFFGKLLDLTMLVIPGGKERTEEEYRELFGRAGFRLSRVVPTAAEVSVIEGVRMGA